MFFFAKKAIKVQIIELKNAFLRHRDTVVHANNKGL